MKRVLFIIFFLLLIITLRWPGQVNRALRIDEFRASQQMRRLASDDAEERKNAAHALARLGPRADAATGALLRTLEDSDAGVRFASALALKAIQPASKEALDSLAKALRDPEGVVQMEASSALARLGERAIPVLLSEMLHHDPDWPARGPAAYGLSGIGTPAIPALIQAMEHESLMGRGDASFALQRLGPQVVPALTNALENAGGPFRAALLRTLGKFQSAQQATLPLLAHYLNDTSASVRSAASDALAQMGSEVVPFLRAALRDSEEDEVKASILQGLARIGPDAQPALSEIVAHLRSDPDSDSQARVPSAAALALGKIGEAAIPSILRELRSDEKHTRLYAATAFVHMGPEATNAIPGLIDLLQNGGPAVAASAVFALSQIGANAAPAIPFLSKLLAESNEEKAVQVASALYRIDPEAEPAASVLLAAIEHPDDQVRFGAVAALSAVETANERVVVALRNALEDPASVVRWNAAKALGGMKTKDSSVIQALADALADKNSSVQNHAALALGRIGTNSIPALLTALRDESADTRRWAAFGCAYVKSGYAAIPALIDAFNDQDARVRGEAIYAVGRIAMVWPDRREESIQAIPPEVVPALRNALRDEKPLVRSRAAQSLGLLKQGARPAAPDLVAALQDEHFQVSREAAFVLAELGSRNEELIPILEEASTSEQGLIRSKAQRLLEQVKLRQKR